MMSPTGRRFTALMLLSALAAAGCNSPTVIVLEDPRSYVEDRSIKASHEDARIRLDIQALFIEREAGKLKNVAVEVYERAVLLTGTVPEPDAKITAGALAASVKRATPIINEIQVLPDESKRDTAADLAIETKVKKALRDAEEIHSANMRWSSVNGTVYMFGRALSETERDLALAIVGKTLGVKSVVDHIAVRPLAD